MQLETLIKDMPITLRTSAADVAITGLTDDSRAVQLGSLFVARPGADGDATRFVAQAIQAGAAAVLLPTMDAAAIDRLNVPDTVAIAQSQTPIDQRLCGQLAERFYNHPSRKLKLIGVTGTNGKTTTVTIAKHLLESAGHKTGLIGTVELDTGSPQGPTPATLTTPGAIQLTELLAEMVANGCACCVMEVSSHALHQGRADHVRFTAAAFTNLTQDHLDYHGDMQAYADAKAILFESLDEDATAVLNIDDRASRRMQANCKGRVLHTDILGLGDSASAGHATDTMCTVTPTKMTAACSQAEFAGPWQCFAATLPMPGLFNLNNALQAAALAYTAAGLDAAQLRQGLETCHAVPGRLEPVGPDWPQPASPNADLPSVLVDYAHTPDALINVGNALHQLTQPIGGKLITVFGCGGDRDRNKRPLMAQAAQQFADTVVLTSDNPRTEDPRQILNDAEAGFAPRDMTDPNPKTHTIADRAEAIRFAIHLAEKNDTVLIAGKGHEDYQIIGTTKHHFDDREQAAAALREKSGQ